MIGAAAERRGDWVSAIVLSALVHGALAVWAFDLWPRGATPPTPPQAGPLPEIRIAALSVADDSAGFDAAPGLDPPATAALQPETLQPVQPDVPELSALSDPPPDQPQETPAPSAGAETLSPVTGTDPAPSSGSAAQLVDPAMPGVVAPVVPDPAPAIPGGEGAGSGVQVIAALPVQPGGAGGADGAAAGAADGPPPTPEERALADMLARIRANLGQSCLLALPQRLGETELGLTVLADSDRGLTAMVDEVTAGLNVPVTRRAVLVDPRQCAAVSFLRAQPSYPAFGLGLGVEATEIASGGRLRGEVTNAGGRPVTLLLVDDNGVVQDLRRFMTFAGGRATFDVPVRRAGQARDTGQLLIAVASAERPRAVAENADRLAADFFPALSREIAAGAAVGVVSVDIR